MIALPVRVLLRDRSIAEVKQVVSVGPEFAPTRMLVGLNGTGGIEMWFTTGKWSERGAPHSHDIVGFVNPDATLRPLTNEFSQ